MKGFFQLELPQLKAPQSMIPKCGKCGLLDKCKTPKMPLYGLGKRKVLIIGEAPGRNEDEKGIPFVGESGQILKATLHKLKIDIKQDCWVTNSLICRPEGNEIGDENRIIYCRPNVIKVIQEKNPQVIILLGAIACKSVIGWLWKDDDVGGINRWVGAQIPAQKTNCWVCPTWHPSFVMRSQKDMPLAQKTFDDHLKAAFSLKSRPFAWDSIPDYKSQVDIIYEPEQASAILSKMIDRGGTISFDYETDRLKPDSDDAQILCCSVCWEGKKTIAYPWCGSAIDATKRLLRSDLAKVAANGKFEWRWTYKEFGCGVKNWTWDTMLAAHVLDNRPNISSLKYQAFVKLGQESYDWYLENNRKSGGSNTRNQMKKVGMRDLLLYCGMDALLEFKLFEIQKRSIESCMK